MHEQDKRDANDHQIQLYFTSYDRFWRLNKLFLIKKSLEDRDELTAYYKKIYGDGYFDYDKYVYENITNGLLADAVSETVMLCEDYFGILKFIRDRHYFVKRIVNYKAGSVAGVANKLKTISNDQVRRLFFIPDHEFVQINFTRGNVATANSDIKLFNSRLQMLLSSHNEAIRFYHSKIDAYNSYKHGLKLCLNGFGQGISEDALEERKKSLSAGVFKFENKNTNISGMILPNIANRAIRNNTLELFKDRNLLHFALLHEVHIDSLITMAKNIMSAITVLVANRTSLISDEGMSQIEVCLPSGNNDRITSVAYSFQGFPNHPIPTIKNYQVKL